VPNTSPRARVDAIEAELHEDVGRGIVALFAASKGGLWRAVSALAASPAARIGLMTGFYVPLATPPAAETDGPVGAALLARGLAAVGFDCRLLTDDPCRSACEVALHAAGLNEVVEVVSVRLGPASVAAVSHDAAAARSLRHGISLEAAIEHWREAGVDWAIAIERCGRSAGGPPRNMRGEDISAHAAPLDELFRAGPWRTMAIGDGGNEIGMGALPRAVVARAVDYGELIACVTPADHLVTAGVSHWGAYALLAGLAVIRPDWRDPLLGCLDPEIEQRILETTVRDGPAVDGVTLRQEPTVDRLDFAAHCRKAAAIRRIVEQKAA
jgi:hypothetical protein